ncbi:MAG: NAD(P)H-hydrate epimerase [Tabrizicola sp.]
MTELLTAAQMRAIEQAAIASGEVTGLELMERAGRGVVEAIFEEWPALKATSHRAVVLCGPGNNGGDGFVVARLLKEWGWEVEDFLYGDPERMPPDARANYERWVGIGEVRDIGTQQWDERPFPIPCDIVVDALFGTGLTRPVDLPVVALLDARYPWAEHRTVSVDVPSGLCADSGREIGENVVAADLTVTFHWPRVGHVLGSGPSWCFKVVTKPLWSKQAFGGVNVTASGVPPSEEHFVHFADQIDALWARAELIDRSYPGQLRMAGKETSHHKYSHGHALILSGPSGRGGAARLAARGALRIGAGVVFR